VAGDVIGGPCAYLVRVRAVVKRRVSATVYSPSYIVSTLWCDRPREHTSLTWRPSGVFSGMSCVVRRRLGRVSLFFRCIPRSIGDAAPGALDYVLLCAEYIHVLDAH
jgi:hypothetical protein